MQPGDMHFAAVWPVANGGVSRKSIVPFQCSLAEASETLDRLACTPEAISATVSGDEIGTAVLGAFCVFSAATASSAAFIVVGTKTWTVASSVISYIRRVQAELTRDPVDFGYWQLRSLAWRAEEAADGEDTSINTMPPRLIEGRDWDDEESESWEEDDVRSERACDSPSAKAELVVASGGACSADTTRLGERPPGVEPRAGMGASTGDAVKLEIGTTSLVTVGPASDNWSNPFFKANSNESSSVLGAAPTTPKSSMIDQRKTPLIDFFASPPSAPAQSSSAFTSSAEIGQGHVPSVDLLTAPVTPSSAAGIAVTTAPVHGPSPVVNTLGPQFVATAPLITMAAIQQPEPAVKDNTTDVSNTGISLLDGLEEENVQDNETRSDASGHARGASESTTPVSGPRKLLAAVREDLAYVYEGQALKKYAITGSVRVTTSENRVIVRLTDRQGHIAKVNANPAVATETSSTLPMQEYSCDTSSQTMGATRPNYLQAVIYKCSPAVRQLPVRVTCHLRTVGGAVLVRAQIIVNPQISSPLEDISALIHLPFSPRIEGNVKSDPQATWNADRRILKWSLPTSMNGGDKIVLQARLAVDEAMVREGAIPPIAPAMVECQLSDTTFSSIEFTASKTNALDGFEVTGEVVKRCWVRCRQQS